MTERPTMADVDHPEDGRFHRELFRRGPRVVADGGSPRRPEEREGRERPEDGETDSMADVSHTPADGDGADRVWDGTRVRPREDDDE